MMGKGFSRYFRSSIQPFMVHYVELMQRELGSPPNLQQAKRMTRDISVDIHVFGAQQNWSTADALLDRNELIEVFDQHHQNRTAHHKPNHRFRLKRLADDLILYSKDGDHDIYFQIYNRRDLRHGGWFSFFVLFSIVGILVLVYYATRTLFRPIEYIEQGVKQFSEGNLTHRITKCSNNQLGDLTDSVNRMAEDIGNMLEAKRQLLLAISHELRSPLTRSKINLELIDDSTAKSEIDKDIDVMEQLINELLESERLNSPHRVIQAEITDVKTLIEEVIEAEFDAQIRVLELQPIITNVDPTRIKLLLRNLLQNAIKYNQPEHNVASPPSVSLSAEEQQFTITVCDHGVGIASQHLPFLTEPFYRADPSRQRHTGGYGLGLYLCRMIVEAHYGQLKIDSELGKGTQIKCQFPLSDNPIRWREDFVRSRQGED